MKFNFDEKKVSVSFHKHDDHFDFVLQALDPEMEENIKKVRDVMEDDQDLVDVNFLAFNQSKYEVVVIESAFVDFLLQLFKYKVLSSLSH